MPLTDSDLKRFITERQIDAELVYPDKPTPTVADAAQALGVESERIIKSLVFLVEDKPLLVIAAGETKVSQRRLRDVLGVSRRALRMATPEETLELSGFEVGAMPPFGHKVALPTYLDKLTVPQGVLYGGGGTEAAMMKLDYQTLLAVTGATPAALAIYEEEV